MFIVIPLDPRADIKVLVRKDLLGLPEDNVLNTKKITISIMFFPVLAVTWNGGKCTHLRRIFQQFYY